MVDEDESLYDQYMSTLQEHMPPEPTQAEDA